jgi:hypothetical protein
MAAEAAVLPMDEIHAQTAEQLIAGLRDNSAIPKSKTNETINKDLSGEKDDTDNNWRGPA